MFVSGLESFHDNLTWYYLGALLVSVLAIILAFLFSLKNSAESLTYSKNELVSESETSMAIEEETKSDENENTTEQGEDLSQSMKKSPALMAEMVIKANMTEEQKSLEQEVRKKQLAEIFKLMQQETDKFGEISLVEVEEQMKLYQ